MINRLHRSINLLLLMALSLLVIACNGPVVRSPDISASDCRVVQHELGESCVPIQPQRVITLEISWILDPLLALGIKPVGTVSTYAGTKEYFPGLSIDEVAGIEIIGTPIGASLEKILQLKPDLILEQCKEKVIQSLGTTHRDFDEPFFESW